jgi:hypothetical protein
MAVIQGNPGKEGLFMLFEPLTLLEKRCWRSLRP